MEKGGVGELCPFLLLLYPVAQVRRAKWSVNLYGKKMDSCESIDKKRVIV